MSDADKTCTAAAPQGRYRELEVSPEDLQPGDLVVSFNADEPVRVLRLTFQPLHGNSLVMLFEDGTIEYAHHASSVIRWVEDQP